MKIVLLKSTANQWSPCLVDELVCLVNPAKAADFETICRMIPARHRLDVVMLLTGVVQLDLPYALDLVPTREEGRGALQTQFSRWMTREHRMPLGIAFRLEKVFGVQASVLCESYI